MWSNISLYDILPGIKEVVESGSEASFTPEGISRRPMLYGGRDEIALVKSAVSLKKYDLPCYVRKSGKIVLHRVVKAEVKGGHNLYTMRGDNTYVNETGITDGQIVAVVTRFRRKGKWHSVNSRKYRLYTRLWCFIYPIRKPLRAIIRLPFRVFRKLKSVLKKP